MLHSGSSRWFAWDDGYRTRLRDFDDGCSLRLGGQSPPTCGCSHASFTTGPNCRLVLEECHMYWKSTCVTRK